MRDEYGYPGIEDYDEEDLEEIQAFVKVAFKAFNYSWQHERVRAYLAQVEKIVQRPMRSGQDLPYKHYRALAMFLAAEVVQYQEDRRAAADAGALFLATTLIRSSQKQLVGTK